MESKSAVIIIDTGFSLQSLLGARKIIAVLDVASGKVVVGDPYLTAEKDGQILRQFEGDRLKHGSLVLDRLTRVAPELPVVLVKAYDENVRLVRSQFEKGRLSRPGWTEAYLMAVKILTDRGLASVANLSFGGYTHAVDGSGWESHCLAQVTGSGKRGHIVLAGAGRGDGRAIHASWKVEAGVANEVTARQERSSVYNLWCAADAKAPESSDWLLEVFLNDELVVRELSASLMPNLWNNRKQVTFAVNGSGVVRIRVSRFWNSGTTFGGVRQGRHLDSGIKPGIGATRATDNLRFDCWINIQESEACFLDHEDAMSIAEPAIFPHVIAVGLKNGSYAPNQNEPGAKPEVLLDGAGPISFRLPEVVARVARMLAEDPSLDVVAVREKLKA